MKRVSTAFSAEKREGRPSGTYLRARPDLPATMPLSDSLPDVNRATRLIAAGIVELVRLEFSKGHAAGEWVDQTTSPLGHRRHLELVRSGALPASRSGKRVLVRRSDLDAYLAEHATAIAPTEEASPNDAAAVAELLADLGEER
jgi:excisionase family DNA binding protein